MCIQLHELVAINYVLCIDVNNGYVQEHYNHIATLLMYLFIIIIVLSSFIALFLSIIVVCYEDGYSLFIYFRAIVM